MTDTNPFFQDWQDPFGVPPFDQIRPEHYADAIRQGIAAHESEIDAIASNPDAPGFDNTLLPLEQAGELLGRANGILGMLTMAATSPELQELDAEFSPLIAAHHAGLFQNEKLFGLIKAIHDARDSLPPQDRRLVETYYRNFIESGAALDAAGKQRFIEIQSRLSELYATFKQNLLAEDKAFVLELNGEDDKAGLPDAILQATAAAAEARGMPGKNIVTLSASLRGPFMTFSSRRDLREKLYKAGYARARQGGANDNRETVLEIIRLRADLGRLMGAPDYGHYALENTMAKSPAGASSLLDSLWQKALPGFQKDWQDIQALADEDGLGDKIEKWDWAYYAEKLRQRELAFSAEEVRPYLTIDNVLDAAFYTASRLFNICFVERRDIPVYDADVRVWEIQDKDGNHIAVYYGDYYARSNKLDGGWMSHLRNRNPRHPQHGTPVVYNVCNFNKPAPGQPSLLSLSDMETVFHELGHVLHEALTQADHPSLAGTSVLRDFVELPSQLMEHWVTTDEILEKFAHHHATGEIMPAELRQNVRHAQTYRQSSWLVSYLATAQLDIAWHALSPEKAEGVTVEGFEQQLRERIGLPDISNFYSTTAFLHLFDGPGYASLYYIYIWAQVLDADAFEAFTETSDIFHPETARRLLTHIYSAGNSDEPSTLYEKFRGRPADPDALIRKLGFAANDSAVQDPTTALHSTHG